MYIMKKLVIVPAYNESESIEKTIRDIMEKAPEFDYVIVNDCSTDSTLEICRENQFNILNLPINLGIGGAVQTGYIYAKENGYDIAVQVDGDGQHDPTFLSVMAKKMEETGADMIIGSRFIAKEGFQSSAARRVGIKYFSALIKCLTGEVITDPTSGLRMIGKRGIELFAGDYPKDYPEPESTLAMLRRGMEVVEMPVIMKERQGGVSSIRLQKTVYYMIKVTLAILVERMRK